MYMLRVGLGPVAGAGPNKTTAVAAGRVSGAVEEESLVRG